MASYIQFKAEDDSTILVEVEEVSSTSGLQQTSLQGTVKAGVAAAQTTFEAALGKVVRVNAQALLQGVKSLPEKPTQVELSFGLKATGQVGNMAICKASGEATYSIKLVWQSQKSAETSQPNS